MSVHSLNRALTSFVETIRQIKIKQYGSFWSLPKKNNFLNWRNDKTAKDNFVSYHTNKQSTIDLEPLLKAKL